MTSKLGIKGTAKVERFNSLTNERKLIIIPAAIAALLIERCSYLSVPFPKNTVKNNYTYNSTTILSWCHYFAYRVQMSFSQFKNDHNQKEYVNKNVALMEHVTLISSI